MIIALANHDKQKMRCDTKLRPGVLGTNFITHLRQDSGPLPWKMSISQQRPGNRFTHFKDASLLIVLY